ncbi:MAG TPA: hypothetical protein VIK18_24535, partial [Pirellulales bacterium]
MRPGRSRIHRWCLTAAGPAIACLALTVAAASAAELVTERVLTPAASAGSDPPVVTAVAIHPAGRMVASAGDDHLVRLWDTETGGLVRELRGHTDWVRCLAFHPA